MRIVSNVFFKSEEMTISKKFPVDKKSLKGNSELLSLLEEKEQRIAELERLLNQKRQEIWNFKLLRYKIKNLRVDNFPQDLPLSQQYNNPDKAFADLGKLLEITQEFMCRIKKRFPALSANDLRICSLLRQNLSTKEVARYLGIGADSANKARYRIRKKLSLKRSDNLIQFLLEF